MDANNQSRIVAANSSTGLSKALLEWLNLLGVLAIPFVVAAGTLFITQQITQQQAQFAQQQHQTDLQIAEDQQRETTLKTYLDDMSDLLLNHSLRKSKPGDEVSLVARERTLTTLRRLDADRNRIVLQFLQDAQLIDMNNAVIDLSHADLSYDDLRGADLSNTNLSHTQLDSAYLSNANLTGADLSGANLSDAHLDGAGLTGADLTYTDLSSANLTDAHLSNVSLTSANLTDTDLSGADLTGARLTDAIVTEKQLAEAKSLQGATMPNGSKHP